MMARVHHVPAERAHWRSIDEEVVCEAIDGIGDPEHVRAAAARFALLGDPGRLTLLLAMRATGEISVTDLALASGLAEPAVSQALRLLRTAGVVAARREGRIARYRLVDPRVADVLGGIGGG
jgi:DNA-binding transcriptional ArsR family regulator